MKLVTFFVFLVFWTFYGFGSDEIQRVILPGNSVELTCKSTDVLSSLSIDYTSESMMNEINEEIQLKHIYLAENVKIKINGKPSSKNLSELVADSLPLVNILYLSEFEIIIEMVKENAKKLHVKNIEIDFISPVFIGTTLKKDVTVANAILVNYVYNLNQEEFFRKLKLAEILESNKQFQVNQSGFFTNEIKEWIDRHDRQYDFSFFSGKQFKTLITNSIFQLDAKGELTETSFKKIKLAYLYFKNLNMVSENSFKDEKKVVSSINYDDFLNYNIYKSKPSSQNLNEKIKREKMRTVFKLIPTFFETESQLTRLNNPALLDTIFDGA